MARFYRQVHKKVALPPGTIEFLGAKKVDAVRMSILDYSEQLFEEKDHVRLEDCEGLRDSSTVSWININGLHDTELIEEVGRCFTVHPLVLEDIVHTNQRTKLEDYDNHIYLVLKMLQYDSKSRMISAEQVSIVLGKGYVLSFQEREGDVFEPVRNRVRNGKGRIRKLGADYLAYALLDAVVDSYYEIFEVIGERIEELEQRVAVKPTPEVLADIYETKREVVYLRKNIWPLREVVGNWQRSDTHLVDESTRVFLRDVYDHTIQVIDSVESFRDLIADLQDLYLSSISNRMNEVMKVLTIIATIFVPLTFIAGIYGMNFEFMPELAWKWSYPLFWLVIGSIAGGMIFAFRRRRWF